ncbi:Tetratricopeptide TPR_2 repeat protein [Catenulispora acidiphila DSM 44928]|uniref:Tetratricopeptide TPR_2 repeat protein n=1 Tax=Catenulispora acidiphila (strain DSM 44928 / JCM 14897 / NBRC 102108 / NRRL B-24433 / ID139908) TaxID=479433 RepID=C7PVJ3_CATAD|nr:tetratricopeptide repeat protein [Catenulispora acidiphila]ACU69349.1 Tetratricopeptide TPR_2 repeat protein [Catenulispora acidiphila DSM 44928]
MPLSGDGQQTQGQIGARLQEVRTRRGLTQRALAEPGYTAAYVSTLEAGKARASEAALRYFAERLAISYEELATGVPAGLRAEIRDGLAEANAAMDAGRAAEAEALLAALLERAAGNDVPDLAADVRVALGAFLLRRGDLAAGREQFEQAEALLADRPLVARVRAIRGRATAYYLEGDVRYSCYLLENTISELNGGGLPDPASLVLLYAAVIGPYLELGALERATKAATLALDLAPRVADPIAVATLHRSVARTLAAGGRFDEAEAALVKAQDVYQQWEIRAELAQCHWMRGYLYAQHERFADAETELRTAATMLRAADAVFYAVQVEVELADVRWRLGHTDEAEHLLTRLLADLGPGHGAVHAAAAHRLLGLIRERADDPQTAERHYRQAIELQQDADVAGDLADTSRLLGDLLDKQGRTREAVAAYRNGLTALARPGTTTLGAAPLPPPVISALDSVHRAVHVVPGGGDSAAHE